MNKKKIIWIGCALIGITFIFVICNLIANYMYKKQTIAYVGKVKSEYDSKLKYANESMEKLKNDFAEISKKQQEYQQNTEEKNKGINKELEKKDNSTTQNKETSKSNQPQESPNLLNRERLSKLDKNFWATRLYYMNMALAESESSARDMLNNATVSSKVKKIISEYVQNLNENYARFKEVESLGIPSVCKADYQKFKNLYSQYIKSYMNIYDENAKTHINTGEYNKCKVILDEVGSIFMEMESKLK